MPAHLSKGSQDPPLQEGKLRLYSMRFCPYAHRVHLALIAKKVPYDPVYINLLQKPEWYTASVPTGKVPALKTEGSILYESLIISEYLDEKYEGQKLAASTPLQKALDKIFLETFSSKHISPYYKAMMEGVSPDLFAAVLTALATLENELTFRGTPYLAGDSVGLVDYMIWPWLERLPLLTELGGPQYALPEDKCAHIIKYISKMKEDPAVKEFYLSTLQHATHIKRKREGLSSTYED